MPVAYFLEPHTFLPRPSHGLQGGCLNAPGDEHRRLPMTRSRRDRGKEKTTGEKVPAANAKEGGLAVDVKAYNEQVTPLESL